jgi:two-component system CheB/CheR fusion protein
LKRILIVEDHRDAASMLAELLQVHGYEALCAPDGPRALELAESFKPHVALLDIELPNMDGYQLARRLRVLPDMNDVVLIAVTGHGEDTMREWSRKYGFRHHFLKPLDHDELLEVLRKVG